MNNKEITSLKLTNESLQIGKELLNTLNNDSKKIQNCNNLINNTEYNIDTSNKLIKGINNWIIKFFNLFSFWRKKPLHVLIKEHIYSCPDCIIQLKSNSELVEHYNNTHVTNKNNIIKLYEKKQSFISELEEQLYYLHDISINLNYIIDSNNKELNDLYTKTNNINKKI